MPVLRLVTRPARAQFQRQALDAIGAQPYLRSPGDTMNFSTSSFMTQVYLAGKSCPPKSRRAWLWP